MNRRQALVVTLVLLLAAGATTMVTMAQGPTGGQPLATVGSSFTYQGQLKNGPTAVNGTCDFQFGLWDALALGAQIGVTQTKTISVTGGLFSTPLDFGAGAFDGQARWLEIQVACPAGSAYVPLTPRQELTPAPYALFATTAHLLDGLGASAFAAVSHLHAGEDIITGTVADARIPASIARDSEITATILANDGPGTGLNADLLDGLNSTAFVRTTGDQSVSGVKTFREGITFGDGSVQSTAFYRPLLPGPGASVAVDRSAYAGKFSALTIGADGLGLVSYLDSGNNGLAVLHCGNAPCNAGNTTTVVDDSASVGYYGTSITIGADGLGLIAYHDLTNSALKVLHCGDIACASGNISTTVDNTADVGEGPAITTGADGLGLVAYLDNSNADLKVLHCGNAACSSNNVSHTVDSTGIVGHEPSITIGRDGLGLISYIDVTNGDLKVLHCGDAVCGHFNTSTTIDTAGMVGSASSITIGPDGFGLISYSDATNGDLKVLHCGNAACSSQNVSTAVDVGGDVGGMTSITIGADGLGLISYRDNVASALKMLHCGAPDCSTGNQITTVDSESTVTTHTSVAIGFDGLGLVSYYDDLWHDLRVFHCANLACSPYIRVGR